MISTFISIKDRTVAWLTAHPAWRWALGVYLVARVLYSLWAIVIVVLNPLVVSNLDLFGVPVVAAFDLRTSEHAAFSRVVGERALHFRAGPSNLADIETASTWDMSGRAIAGTMAGNTLAQAAYSTEDVYPYRGVATSDSWLLAPWQRFDTNWYIKIAERGYSADDGSMVYLPLYPLLIRAVGVLLMGNDLLAALLVSNLALIGALYLLYELVRERWGVEVAGRTLVYLLVFPTAFFLFAAYTESLFFFLSLAALREGSRSNWALAGVLGALAALTRLQGVLLIIPLGYLWWVARARSKTGSARDWRGAALLLMPLATAGFLGFLYLFVGNAELLAAYEGLLHAHFVMPWDNVVAGLALVRNGSAGFADVVNLAATFSFAGMLVVLSIRNTIPRAWLLYAAVMFLAPLFRMTTTQPLVSMARYVLVLFPIFIVWADWGRNTWVNRLVVYLGLSLSLYLSAQFIMWGWVG